MERSGFVGLKNEFGEYARCETCGSPFVKMFHIEGGRVTREVSSMGRGVELSGGRSQFMPHAEILCELYAIRGAMAMVSENTDEMDSEEKFFLQAYLNDFRMDFVEKAWRKYMGKFDKYLLTNMIAEKQKELEEIEKSGRELRSQIETVKNTKFGLFGKSKQKMQIAELEEKLSKVEAEQAKIERRIQTRNAEIELKKE